MRKYWMTKNTIGEGVAEAKQAKKKAYFEVYAVSIEKYHQKMCINLGALLFNVCISNELINHLILIHKLSCQYCLNFLFSLTY
jgi:hypothetical protein